MTDLLFAQDSFFAGMARAIDLGAVFDQYNESADGNDADRRATASDWHAVGQDIQFAMNSFGKPA